MKERQYRESGVGGGEMAECVMGRWWAVGKCLWVEGRWKETRRYALCTQTRHAEEKEVSRGRAGAAVSHLPGVSKSRHVPVLLHS